MLKGKDGKFISEGKLLKHKCLICSKEFSSYKKNAKYCSRDCWGKREMRTMRIKCDYCKKKFKRQPSVIKKVNFCSRECWNKWRAIYINCKICGKRKKVASCRIKNDRAKYCSRECFLKDLSKKLKTGLWGNCKECNKKIYVQKSAVGRKKFCSNSCKAKWEGRKRRGKKIFKITGKNHWNWKGGISDERTKLWNSGEYTEWRKRIYEKDNYTCQKCGEKTGGSLVPHHIDSFADFPELRFKVSNGITFCKNCHTYFHSKYGTHHNNRQQLEEFLYEKQESLITRRGGQIMVSEISKRGM